MGLTTNYLITTKNMEAFFNAILTAKAPEKFTNKFLTQLEFKTTNDRLFIGLLKSLGFIDELGTPTQRYYSYLDQSQSKSILAEAIREAYADLFNVNQKAHALSADDVKNKLKTLTEGKKSEKVIQLMANTFIELCKLAEWRKTESHKEEPTVVTSKPQQQAEDQILEGHTGKAKNLPLHYNIQIHLPESRDPAVYDAIFRSLKQHLV